MGVQRLDRVVVVGGSVTGLAAAAALAPHAAEVCIVERQPPGSEPAPASVVPHGRFAHVLLAGGVAALERLCPGLTADLVAHGAIGSDPAAPQRCHWWAAGRVRRELPDLGIVMPACSRALVEARLRRHVTELPNVRVEAGVVVRGLRIGGGRVRGVEGERAGEQAGIGADLVVDASGRGSSAPAWLEHAGFDAPPMDRVDVRVTYTGVDVRRAPGDLDGARFAVVQNSPALARIGVGLPAEGDRWQVVLGGYFGDSAPTTRGGLLEFAASLPDPAIHELLQNEWLGEPRQHRFPSSQRRRWERVRLPAGFCVVGDAVASFNPIYGQGMSAGALQAEALAACLGRVGNTAALPRAVARATAKVVDNPWRIATGADFVYGTTTGRRAPGTTIVNRYLEQVMRASAVDDTVNLALTRVQQLLAPPTSLFRPGVVRRVRRLERSDDQPAAVVVVDSSLMST